MLKLVTLLDQIYKILDLQKKKIKTSNKTDDEGREKIKKSQK